MIISSEYYFIWRHLSTLQLLLLRIALLSNQLFSANIDMIITRSSLALFPNHWKFDYHLILLMIMHWIVAYSTSPFLATGIRKDSLASQYQVSFIINVTNMRMFAIEIIALGLSCSCHFLYYFQKMLESTRL